MRNGEEAVDNAEEDHRHGAEIYCYDSFAMVAQNGSYSSAGQNS
jgi:hypothetical protein